MDENLQKSFTRLKSLVLDDAHRQSENSQNELNEEYLKKLQEKENELKSLFDKKRNEAVFRIEKESKESILQKELEAKRELSDYRNQIADKVFSAAVDKLNNFMNTDEYSVFLSEKTRLAISLCGEGEKIIYLRHEDIKKIAQDLGIIKECDILGGVKVENPKKGIVIDFSFDDLLENEKQEFYKTSGLTIGI